MSLADRALWPGVDPTKANVARTYDFWLGGTNNFSADRELGRALATLDPHIPAACMANRAFLGRAVRFLAGECGIRQFLDIGSGIPTQGNVHEIAQRVAPGARVAYVDRDAAAAAQGRAVLKSMDSACVVEADLRQPGSILRHPDVLRLIDFDEPVAILFVAILHFIVDVEDPNGIVARYGGMAVPGSYLVISHASNQANAPLAGAAVRMYTTRAADVQARSREEIRRFFGGWDLVEPGLVYAPEWRPDAPGDAPNDPERYWFLTGVARKPAALA